MGRSSLAPWASPGDDAHVAARICVCMPQRPHDVEVAGYMRAVIDTTA